MARGYPLSLDLVGKKCLVIGGGAEADLRERALSEAGAVVVRMDTELDERELDEAWLVVQTSQDDALAERLGQLCMSRRIFFCAIDQPTHSSYSHLALARAGALTVAIGTEGKAPALGRRLREELTRVLNAAGAASEVERLAQLRAEAPPAERRELMARAVSEVELTGELRFRKPEP